MGNYCEFEVGVMTRPMCGAELRTLHDLLDEAGFPDLRLCVGAVEPTIYREEKVGGGIVSVPVPYKDVTDTALVHLEYDAHGYDDNLLEENIEQWCAIICPYVADDSVHSLVVRDCEAETTYDFAGGDIVITTDDEACLRDETPCLPDTVVITDDSFACIDDEDELDEAISDWLSNEYGYCHSGFAYEFDDNGNIVVSDIRWDIEK